MVERERRELARLICSGRVCNKCPIIAYCGDRVAYIPDELLISKIHKLICSGDSAMFESLENTIKYRPERYKIFLKYCNEIQYENH